MNTDLIRSIEQATTIDELVRQFEALRSEEHTSELQSR